MLYINGKLVNFNNSDQSYEFADIVNDYRTTIDELKRTHGDKVSFVTRKGHRIDQQTQRLRPPKGYAYPNKLKLITDDGPQEWIYSSSIATVKDGVVITQDPYFYIKDVEVSYSLTEEPDFIFFLTKHRAIKTGRLKLYDPDAEQRQRADSMLKETRVKDLIYSENSPLYDDHDLMKTIARKWGIGNVDSMKEYEIKNNLHDAVMSGEKAKLKGTSEHGIEEFLQDFNLGDGVKIGSLIQMGIDKEILYFDRESSEWKAIIDHEQSPLAIMMVDAPDRSKSRQKLTEYLLRNKHDATLLEKAISGDLTVKYGKVYDKGDVTVDRSVTEANVDTLSFTELQKAASKLKLGKQSYGKKKEELRALVKEALEKAETV